MAELQSTGAVPRIRPAQQTTPAQPGIQKTARDGNDFSRLLERTLARQQPLQFSKHVQERLQQRDLQLTSDEMARLNAALDLAQKKGIRDSLILTRDAAFIVNVPSKVVVTAMQREAAAFRVFTNIDGAIISE